MQKRFHLKKSAEKSCEIVQLVEKLAKIKN